MKTTQQRFTAGSIFGVYVLSLLVQPVVYATTDTDLKAPIRETIFVTNPEDKTNAPETSETIYYSQKEIEFDAEQALETIKKLSGGVQEILDEVDKLDLEFGDTNVKYQQTKKEIFRVVKEMESAKDSLESSVEKIGFYQQKMVESAEKIQTIRNQIESTKENIQRFTTFMYKFQNDLYGSNGSVDEVKLFINADEDVSDVLSNSYYVQSFIEKLQVLMDELKQEEKSQVAVVRESNSHKRQAQDVVEHYQQRIQDLNTKQQYLKDFLELYRDNSEKIEGTIQALFDTRMEAQNVIDGHVKDIVNETYSTSFNVAAKLKELNALEPTAPNVHMTEIDWPLYPINDIRYFFKDPSYKEEFGIEMQGIEIPTIQTTLYAPRDAIVYKIYNKGSLGVNWVMLLHTDGYVSILKFFSGLIVKEGDIVRRGHILGYSGGGTPLMEGAGFLAEGANLSFLVAKDGEYQDPMQLLDLSVVKNKSILSKDYKLKYFRDLYSLQRDRYKEPFLEGTTNQERFDKFLSKYGVGVYASRMFWEDAAEGTGIPPEIGACIGFAESSLGANLTTSNNIGNVGNNDRGDRIGYNAPLEGAKLIFDTLNNQYLGGYSTLAEVNGYGGGDGKKYATSEINWQNNVTRCLTMIYAYHVPDNFPFRLDPNPKRVETEKKE